MNKNVIAVTCVLASTAAASGIVAAANAQDAPPTVTVTVAPKSATFEGADALKAGPTKLVFKVTGKGERGVALFKLKPGVDPDEMAKAAAKIRQPADAHRYGSFVASTFIAGRETYTTTVDLPAADYVLADFTNRPAIRAGFTVAPERSTAVAPAPAATISMDDYRFDGPSTLPRNGVLRVDNDGKKIHHALLFRLAPKANARKIMAALRRGQEPPNSSYAGPPSALVEIVSPGASNAVDAKLAPGRSLLVCFISDGARKPPHAALGMAKLVTVK